MKTFGFINTVLVHRPLTLYVVSYVRCYSRLQQRWQTWRRRLVAKSPLSTARNASKIAGVFTIPCFCMCSTRSLLVIGSFIAGTVGSSCLLFVLVLGLTFHDLVPILVLVLLRRPWPCPYSCFPAASCVLPRLLSCVSFLAFLVGLVCVTAGITTCLFLVCSCVAVGCCFCRYCCYCC